MKKPPHEIFEVGDFVLGDVVDSKEPYSYGIIIKKPNENQTYNDGSWFVRVLGTHGNDRVVRIRFWYGKRLIKYETFKANKIEEMKTQTKGKERI